MYPFTQSVNPAVRTHLDCQLAFVNAITKSVFHSFEKVCGLNIQLVQSMAEETVLASKHMLTTDHQTDVIAALASHAQPMAEQLRAYHQHISGLAADSQVKLSQVTEEHMAQTSRSAHALAEEVARAASEETERSIGVQQENLCKFSNPFKKGSGQDGQQSTRTSGNAGNPPAGMSDGARATQGRPETHSNS
jgi:phasin family protein